MEQLARKQTKSRERVKFLFIAFSLFLCADALRDAGAIIDKQLYSVGLPYGICIILFSLIAAFLYHIWFNPEFNGFIGLRGFWLGFLILLPDMLGSMRLILKSPTRHIENKYIIFYVGVAIFEEIACRGIFESYCMKRIKNTKNLPLAIVLMGVFFGLLHFRNILSGQDIGETYLQVCSTIGMGIMYSFAFLACGTIWPGVFGHFLHNYMCLMYETDEATESISQASPFVHDLVQGSSYTFLIIVWIILLTALPIVRDMIIKKWSKKWHKGIYSLSINPDDTALKKTATIEYAKEFVISLIAAFTFAALIFVINYLLL